MSDRYQEVKQEALAFEDLMDQVHSEKPSSLSEDGSEASQRIGKDWLNLAMFGKEVLGLSHEEELELEKLFSDLLVGSLNDEGREKDLDKLIAFKLRFEMEQNKKQGKHHGASSPDWKHRAKTTLLIILVVIIFVATYVYAQLIRVVLG